MQRARAELVRREHDELRLLVADRAGVKDEQDLVAFLVLHALASAADRYRVLVLTLGYCGLRWGEASALRVRNVDMERGRLNITDGVTEVDGRIVFATPKSHQARWLPVPAFLLDDLAEEIKGRGPDELVFPSPQGAVMRVQNFRRSYFDRAAKQVGVVGWFRTSSVTPPRPSRSPQGRR